MSDAATILQSILKDAIDVDDTNERDFWAKSINDKKAAEAYIQYAQRFPVHNGVIFYETMSGARVGDNPLAVFEYLRSHPEYGTWLHVWSLDSATAVPEQYVDVSDVIFVRRTTRAYPYFLARAERVVCNANLPGYYFRRPDQHYLNTWHGVPYKRLGRDVQKARFGSPGGTATFLKATHVLSTCRFMTDAMLSAYSMTGTTNASIAETGYPRVDLTVKPDPVRLHKLRSQLSLPTDPGEAAKKPVVLYAPTWRAEVDEDIVDTDQLLAELQALATVEGIHLMYRGHHKMNRIIQDQTLVGGLDSITIPSHDISTNDLLTVVDLLITDYSSIFFDFLPTGRPIIHYLYDYEEYKATRGLNLELDELPGVVAMSSDELLPAVREASNALGDLDPSHDLSTKPLQGSNYARAQEKFCPHEDGHASQRAVEYFFGKDDISVPIILPRDNRPTAVFWAGTLSSNIFTSVAMQRVIESGNSSAEQTTLVIDRMAQIPKLTIDKIRKLGTAISTISYSVTPPVLLPAERNAYESFLALPALDTKSIANLLEENPTLHEIFSREYRRRLDDVQFDQVILAPDLSNHELAVAYFAGENQVLLLNKKEQHARKLQVSLARVSAGLLPYGSVRRKRVSNLYRKIRTLTRKS